MGKTSGYISLGIGITFLIVGIFNPGSLILAAVALIAAYVNLKGEKKQLFTPASPSIHNPDVPTTLCQECGTENFSTAKICRGCNKSLNN